MNSTIQRVNKMRERFTMSTDFSTEVSLIIRFSFFVFDARCSKNTIPFLELDPYSFNTYTLKLLLSCAQILLTITFFNELGHLPTRLL